jgi:hypothetical protein
VCIGISYIVVRTQGQSICMYVSIGISYLYPLKGIACVCRYWYLIHVHTYLLKGIAYVLVSLPTYIHTPSRGQSIRIRIATP